MCLDEKKPVNPENQKSKDKKANSVHINDIVYAEEELDFEAEVHSTTNDDFQVSDEAQVANVTDSTAQTPVASSEDSLQLIAERIREMNEESAKLLQMHKDFEQQWNLHQLTDPVNMSFQEKKEIDSRSIYVGNVDYGASTEELQQHFRGCGVMNRVKILCNKYTGHPKGAAYIEFSDRDAVHMAMAMDNSLFRGRQITVMSKRTNRPGFSISTRPPRGGRGATRGGTSRGFFRGCRTFNGSRRGYFAPYGSRYVVDNRKKANQLNC